MRAVIPKMFTRYSDIPTLQVLGFISPEGHMSNTQEEWVRNISVNAGMPINDRFYYGAGGCKSVKPTDMGGTSS
jgi:hypothetical protein